MQPLQALPDTRGAACLVVDVAVPEGQRRRLAELGLRSGARVAVVQHTAGGNVVVEVAGSRIALDPRTARSVSVSLAA